MPKRNTQTHFQLPVRRFSGSGLFALNLWRMRAFYLAYGASDQKLSQAVTESVPAPPKLKQPVSESPVQRAMALPAAQLHGERLSQLVTESGSASLQKLKQFLGPIYKAFGEKLWPLMDELNLTLAA